MGGSAWRPPIPLIAGERRRCRPPRRTSFVPFRPSLPFFVFPRAIAATCATLLSPLGALRGSDPAGCSPTPACHGTDKPKGTKKDVKGAKVGGGVRQGRWLTAGEVGSEEGGRW